MKSTRSDKVNVINLPATRNRFLLICLLLVIVLLSACTQTIPAYRNPEDMITTKVNESFSVILDKLLQLSGLGKIKIRVISFLSRKQSPILIQVSGVLHPPWEFATSSISSLGIVFCKKEYTFHRESILFLGDYLLP